MNEFFESELRNEGVFLFSSSYTACARVYDVLDKYFVRILIT